MASMQERLKLKRPSFDTWSTREQLCLASSVLKSGDQNWISVSRSLKPFAEKEALRPPDWFSQKSCAIQYAHLLENADTPKRKKRESGETTGECIVKRLTQERIAELGQILAFQRDEYQQLKTEVNLLKSGNVSDEKLQKMLVATEQEEREQEQKARAHSAWLAKRQQQKPDIPSPGVGLGNQRKPIDGATDGQDTTEAAAEDDDKSNRGGRSPLLTSLLKSPSPTMQIQTPTPSSQISSPTIASLLGSSPKIPNPQLSQTVSSQLHQLVSTAIASATPERPSAGAPTLSMLLEQPATMQRGPLHNLQTSTSSVVQDVYTDNRTPSQTIAKSNVQNVSHTIQTPTMTSASDISNSESMVQIIDHIDDVIHKEIMADVINKDEINEIIGDIEELIKEEITGSPQTNETTTKPSISESIVPAQSPVPERQPPRDVDEPVSLSNSPQSEMAIEEIDSSTSNIAEIIGTVAIEPVEPKIIKPETPANILDENKEKSTKSETNTSDKPAPSEEKPVSKPEEDQITEEKQESSEEKQLEEEQSNKDQESIKIVDVDSKESSSTESPAQANTTDEQKETVVESEIAIPGKDDSCEDTERKDILEVSENTESTDLDQLEMNLAKITGDQQNESSGEEVTRNFSGATNDLTAVEDTEKSQDISLILEDDENSRTSQDKKKESVEETTTERAQSVESFKEDTVETVTEEPDSETKEDTTTKANEVVEGTIETELEDSRKEDVKDSSEDTTSTVSQEIEVKEEEVEDTILIENSNPSEPLEEFDDINKEHVEDSSPENKDTVSEDSETNITIKLEDTKVEEESKEQEKIIVSHEEQSKEEIEIKEEKEETKDSVQTELNEKKEITESACSLADDAELDEEESGLNKLSGGRAMKTYSKKQTVAVDSEPENEGSGEGADYRAWKKAVMLVYNRLATHKYASVFLRPITEDQAPGYHSVVFRPMDLSTIKKNIDNGTIRSTMHFQRDVMLMFQNAIMYNKHDTFVYKMAISMQEECLQHMQILVQVTGEGPLRRETRTAASSSSEASDTAIKRKRSHITPSPHDTESARTKKRRKSEND